MEGTTGSAIAVALGVVKDDSISMIGLVAPIAIAILGGFLVWKYGIKFFKKIGK